MIAPVINIASARKPTLSPDDLLTRLRIEGLRVYLKDGSLFVGPQSAVTAEQRKLIREHRDGLIRELEREQFVEALKERDSMLDSLHKQLMDREEELRFTRHELECADLALKCQELIRARSGNKAAIPEDIRRFIASRCHPDHNQDSEVSTRAMAWLNAVPREVRP